MVPAQATLVPVDTGNGLTVAVGQAAVEPPVEPAVQPADKDQQLLNNLHSSIEAGNAGRAAGAQLVEQVVAQSRCRN